MPNTKGQTDICYAGHLGILLLRTFGELASGT